MQPNWNYPCVLNMLNQNDIMGSHSINTSPTSWKGENKKGKEHQGQDTECEREEHK